MGRVGSNLSLRRWSLPAGSYRAQPLPDYHLILTTTDRCRLETDAAGELRDVVVGRGVMGVAPPDYACTYIQHDSCDGLDIALPKHTVTSISEQVVGRIVTDLGPAHGFFRDPLIEALCLRLSDEAATNYPTGRLFTDLAVNTLVAALLGLARNHIPEQRRPNALSGDRLRRVLGHLEDRLGETVSLADLAAVAHLSEYRFARLFKEATGLPPHQYLIRRRVERAKELIRAGRLTLAEIAGEVGFTDQSHFTRHFKKLVGITPKQFG